MQKTTRSQKALKRLRGVAKGAGLKLDKAIHVVNVYARVPVVISGFLVSADSEFVQFRHRKSNGSKKTRITTFPRSVVIEVFGTVGEASQITVWRRNLISTVRGFIKVSNKQKAVKIVDIVSEETTLLYLSDSVELEIFADEDDKGQKVPKKKKAKAVKAKTRRDEEDEDDEEEDTDSDDSEEEDFEEEEDDSEEDDSEDEEDEDL